MQKLEKWENEIRGLCWLVENEIQYDIEGFPKRTPVHVPSDCFDLSEWIQYLSVLLKTISEFTVILFLSPDGKIWLEPTEEK